MTKVSRADKLIATAIVAVLVAILVMAIDGVPGHGASAVTGPATPTRAAETPRPSPTGTSTPGTSSPPAPTPSTPSSTPAPAGTATAPPTSVPTTTTTATTTATVAGVSGAVVPATVTGSVTAVGDSIMLDIQSDLEADIPGVQVDGLVSRQFEAGIGIVQADRAAGTLGGVLVVELGTNGTVTSADFDAMMQAAAGVQRVVFVNVDVPRAWEAPDNAVLAAGVARYPGVAVLADWYTLSSPHPEWFTPDQVHLEPAGAQALATLIATYR